MQKKKKDQELISLFSMSLIVFFMTTVNWKKKLIKSLNSIYF